METKQSPMLGSLFKSMILLKHSAFLSSFLQSLSKSRTLREPVHAVSSGPQLLVTLSVNSESVVV